MSMMGQYRRLSPQTLAQLKANPDAVEKFLSAFEAVPTADGEKIALPADLRELVEAMAPQQREQFLARMLATQEEAVQAAIKAGRPEMAAQLAAAFKPPRREASSTLSAPPGEKAEPLDIQKAWHGLHYLLCVQPWDGDLPLRNAVLGGSEIGPDLGYGPPVRLSPTR